jgi:putative transposase
MGKRGVRRVDDQRVISGMAHDRDALRRFLIERGTAPVIPNNPTRKQLYPFDRDAQRGRNRIERVFSPLAEFRRIATRYDKLTDLLGNDS